MAWDKEHIRQLLNEVVSTKGQASARKSEELLEYVTRYTEHEKSDRDVSADVQVQEQSRPEPG